MSVTVDGKTYYSLTDRVQNTLNSAPSYVSEKASAVYSGWQNRPRYSRPYSPPSGVRYGIAPWYMQYFDKMYAQPKKETNVLKSPWLWLLGGAGVLAFLFYKNKKNTTTTTTDISAGGGISETVLGGYDDFLTQDTQQTTGYTIPQTYTAFVPTTKQESQPEVQPTAQQTQQTVTPTVSTLSPALQQQAQKAASSALASSQSAKTAQTGSSQSSTPSYSGIASVQNTYNAQKSAIASVNAAKEAKTTTTSTLPTIVTQPLISTLTGTTTTQKATSTFSGLLSTQNTYNNQKAAIQVVNSAQSSKTTGKSNEKPLGYGVVH